MSLFISSFILAIAFCAPPGVVTAETLRRGIARGFWPALRVQFGSLIGDSVFAILALAGAAALVQNALMRIVLSALGIGLLVSLAVKAIKDSSLDLRPVAAAQNARGDFVTGALLSLSNPFAIAFWLGIGASIFSALPGGPRAADYAIFFCGYYLALLLWCLFMAALVAWGRKYVTPLFFRWVNITCAAALAYFAFQLTLQLAHNL